MQYDDESFSELHGLGICIPVSCHPNISAGLCGRAIIGPVPAFTEIISQENNFPVPVKDLHPVFCHIAGMQRPEYIVASVIDLKILSSGFIR